MLGIEYDQSTEIKRKVVYSKERELLFEFLEGEQENIKFEYHNTRKAKTVAEILRRWARRNNIKLLFSQRKNFVFATKTIGCDKSLRSERKNAEN